MNNFKYSNRRNLPYPYKDIFLLYLTFLVLAGVFYFFPLAFRYIAIAAVLFGFLISKKDYWWIALFLLIYAGPWGLFSEGTRDASTGIPLVSLGPGFSFTLEQLFLILAIGKAVFYRRPFNSVFKKPLYWIFLYIVFLLLIAFLIGTSINVVLDQIKKVVFWSLVFVFPALIRTRKHTYYLLYLILPVIFLIFIDAIYFSVTGGLNIYTFFNPQSMNDLLTIHDKAESTIIRFYPYGWPLLLTGYIISLALAQIEDRRAKYYYVLAGMAFFVELVTGTRSWFIIFSIIFIWSFWRGEKFRSVILIGGVIFISLVNISSRSNIGGYILEGTIERILTVFEVEETGSSANRAIQEKISTRLPEQLELIKSNPVTGWGFTKKKVDGDVGVFGHIAQVGFLGFFLFIVLWVRYLTVAWSYSKNLRIIKPYRRLFAVFWIGFIGFLISHFTTNQFFGIYNNLLVVTLILWLTDFFIKDSVKPSNDYYST